MQLADRLETVFPSLDDAQKKALRRLGLFSVADLLFYFPARYSDLSIVKRIEDLAAGDVATVWGTLSGLKTKKAFRSKMPMAEGEIADLSGHIRIVWFNQPYLAKMHANGSTVRLTGKVTENKAGLYFTNPEIEKAPMLSIDAHDSLFAQGGTGPAGLISPLYPETRGITSKWFYHAIEKILKHRTLENVADHIPRDILKKYNLPTLQSALVWIHRPRNAKDAESARKRFAFEEVFCIQLERQRDKLEYRAHTSFRIGTDPKAVGAFLRRFPFEATKAQKKAIDVILADMERDVPMSRLLEGDVGSGKTAVAATAAYVTVETRPFDHARGKSQNFGSLQVAYMAPTEILATQHFESFIRYFSPGPGGAGLPIQIGLITGSGCRKFPSKTNPGTWTDISRSQLLKWVANGEIPILIGTHALIQKTVTFKNLALVVIDEQHRFGIAQRRKLVRKDNIAPHLLSMTATPIPRTLALTMYWDLDLTLLDEMPAGRKQVVTEIVPPNKRDDVYEKIRKELVAGRQLYIICPRIFETEEVVKVEFSLEGLSQRDGARGSAPRARGDSDPKKKYSTGALDMKSVVTEAKRLKKEIFPEYEIGVLHSKMSKEKKEKVMDDFAAGRTHILCATSVVEVGVNVPNATMIVIEGAERFGLAQLHQLRGRVLRSTHQAYCYLFAEAKSKKTTERLNAIKTAKNGFELAELDLALRGAGELSGAKQWGITDLGMEAIKNMKMVEAARTEAARLIALDPELTHYPLLRQKIKEKVVEFHFE